MLWPQHRVGEFTALDFLRRSEVTWADIVQHLPAADRRLTRRRRQVEISLKYEGYIARQDRQIDQHSKMEDKLIPTMVDYAKVPGLRNEARQKLTQFTPRSLGQALRISGITPADITLLAIHIDRR